jgi:NADPH2:quinone reductase
MARSGVFGPVPFSEQIPHDDGAGVIDAVGAGVTGITPGQRVWLWHTADGRPSGTAQEYVVLPANCVVPLPDDVSFDVGAALGIPALTAYRTLTLSDLGPRNLRPGALAATTVLVQGGAGAVGHAAIQLAVWAGATVIATVSSPYKAELARLAGAHHVFNYRTDDVATRVKEIAPGGVERIVEVDLATNLATDLDVAAAGGSIATYTATADQVIPLPTVVPVLKNVQMSFVFTYTTSATQKADAATGVAAAVADHAMEVGEEHGLPLNRYSLEQTAQAHDAVEQGTIGKVLIDLG